MITIPVGLALLVVGVLLAVIWIACNINRRVPESDVLIGVAIGVVSCGAAMVVVSLIIVAVVQ
jgi:hypothetical protein